MLKDDLDAIDTMMSQFDKPVEETKPVEQIETKPVEQKPVEHVEQIPIEEKSIETKPIEKPDAALEAKINAEIEEIIAAKVKETVGKEMEPIQQKYFSDQIASEIQSFTQKHPKLLEGDRGQILKSLAFEYSCKNYRLDDKGKLIPYPFEDSVYALIGPKAVEQLEKDAIEKQKNVNMWDTQITTADPTKKPILTEEDKDKAYEEVARSRGMRLYN
jgi:hypothetical protein